jgi:transposase-like protein
MSKQRRVRRLWEDEEKIRIVAQTRVPGVSVSQVARRYDVNANLIFKLKYAFQSLPLTPFPGLHELALPHTRISAAGVFFLVNPVLEPATEENQQAI